MVPSEEVKKVINPPLSQKRTLCNHTHQLYLLSVEAHLNLLCFLLPVFQLSDLRPASSAGPRCVMGRSHTIWRGPAESCKKNGAGVTSANEFIHNLEYKQAIKKRRETCKLKRRL